MLIGVLSDSHDQLAATRKAVRMFESLEVALVIHCGDVGGPATVSLFGAWPSHFVFGNVDNQGRLRQAIEDAGQTCHGRFGSLEMEGKRIAFLHGDDGNLFRETAQSGRWDLVCYGHTHRAETSISGQTRLLNPGALCWTDRPSVAVVRLPSLEVTHVTL